ncbi:peptidoglycan-binding protein [Oryzicola mucosus]|uniref:SEL1-like repeat protein n=1 Tax=Oryzicola mucosus TaxID=2767425 RepID=A0A8J6TWB8_9HYPH|nr:peptidoglycan-binding protein [Oryzicola mucosus]MBD0413276.1 SEL1-like repeat protein [Oryzicola mucosus]
MDNKKSYLDSVNAGRPRRAYASPEQLDRLLEATGKNQAGEAQTPADSYQIIAREIERLRGQEAGLVSIGKIAGELSGMREELNTQVRADLSREFEQLRQDIETRYVVNDHGKGAHELATEFERLSASIRTLADKSDDRHINLLRLELEQVRSMLEGVAREESVKALDKRVDRFAESGMPTVSGEPASITNLVGKLEHIHAAVGDLPRSAALQSVEEKVKTLATALDGFVRQQGAQNEDTRQLIAERLDEISRAIAASSTAGNKPGINADAMLRLETHILALAAQIEDMVRNNGDTGLGEQLEALSARVDDISARADLPAEAFERLSQQIARVADRVDTLPDAERMEERLADIAQRLDKSSADMVELDAELIRSLEVQVAELNQHLLNPGAMLPDMSDFRPRLEEVEKSVATQHQAVLEAARQAAEHAVASLSASQSDAVAAAGLADDLKALEALTRRSEERSIRTFEAIQQTLMKIAERLGALDDTAPSVAEPAVAIAPKLSVEQAPSMDITAEPELLGATAPSHEAPQVPVADVEPEAVKPAKRSMLGGFTLALKGKTKAEPVGLPVEEVAATVHEASMDAPEQALSPDEPLDPKLANMPMEPGSGAPDLNAILKRMRDEREKLSAPGEAETARADIIAAARRAAQVAATEAAALDGSSESKAPMKALGDLVKTRRKPILMAAGAVILALAALQIGVSMKKDALTAADVATPAAVEEPLQTVAHRPKPAEVAPPTRTQPTETIDQPRHDEAQSEKAERAQPQEAVPTAAEPEPKQEAPALAAAPAKPVAAPAETAPAMPQEQTSPDITGSIPADLDSRFGEVPSAALKPQPVGAPALQEAAQKDDPKAMFEVGALYAEGRGVKQDLKAAAYFYEQAANLGLAPAQYRIGNMFEKGAGVDRDLAKAKTWYQLAAAQGNASAMHNLAVLFAMGADGTPDNDSAGRWFQAAAELGVKDSQFNLGILTAKGVGMRRDLEESYKWFALVALEGDQDAAAKRDEVAKSLTPEQLERAKATTALWKPRLLDPTANVVDVPVTWQDKAPASSTDMTKAVETIQALLNQRGYDAGKPDGRMGEKTRTAIRAFQKDNALSATGTVDEPLVEALLARN